MTIARTAQRPPAAKPQPMTSKAPPAKPVDPGEPDVLLTKEKPKGKGWLIFGGPKTDKSFDGFIRACRTAIDAAAEISYVTPQAMCEDIQYGIADLLLCHTDFIEVRIIGTRFSNRATRLVIKTGWNFREVIEGGLTFSLFQPGTQA